ncbi:MAG: DUF2142 domain-containing protein [Actinomycetota bacterium]|nr:DUF2142 domain-containing protein [Actinomycetota bacterium]
MLTFLASMLLAVVWIIAQPPYSGADEPAHFAEAQALYSGQFLPKLVPYYAEFESGVATVHLPNNGAACFIAQPAASAGCDRQSFKGDPTLKKAYIYVSREPFLVPLLTGLPAYLSPHRTGLYLARFLNAVIGSSLFATAIGMAFSRRRPFLVLGIVLAMTPSVVADFGILGTSTLEIGSAVLVWISVALLIDGERMTRGLRWAFTVGSVLLLLSRPISFVYLALALLALAVACRRRTWLSLLRGRGGVVTVVVVGAVSILALAWYQLVTAPYNPNYFAVQHLAPITTWTERISRPIAASADYWRQAIGAVGYNEYNGPWWMTLLWTLVAGLVGGMGLLLGRWRRAAAVAMIFIVILGLQVVVQAIVAPKIDLFWQGRYDLPMLAGVLILSVANLDHHRSRLPELRRLVPLGVAAAGVGQLLLFFGALRRYVVGTNGSFNIFAWSTGWRPPIPVLSLVAAGIVAIALLYIMLAWQLRSIDAEAGCTDPGERSSSRQASLAP